MEDDWDLAEEMLTDVLVSNVYHEFFHENSMLFKDKIVLDVGCRTGLLSLLAIEVGADKVFAVGNMQSASYVTNVLERDELDDVFYPLNGCISEVELPFGLTKVDVIVSEWMGHALFADSLFSEVLEARDKWLVEDGHIIPCLANLYICGVSHKPQPQIYKWLPPVVLTEEYVNHQTIMTEKFIVQRINLTTVKYDEVLQVEFKMKALRKGKVHSCMLFFDIGSINGNGQMQKMFETGPDAPRTYIKQTLLSLDEDALDVVKRQLLSGLFIITLNRCTPRGVHFSLGLRTYE